MLLKLDLGLMLELFQFHTGPANNVDGFHEALHAFPHVRDWALELVLQLRCQGNFVLREGFNDLGRPWRMRL